MNRVFTASPICGMPSAAVGGATSDKVPTAAIRHAMRALASETGPLTGRGVKLLRSLVAQAHEVLRERLEAGGSVEAYLRGRTRLADSAVIGLLHIASVSSRMRGGHMVAPLAVLAVGGYGRSELAPGSDLDLLFLLPESSQSGDGAVAAATETCIKAVVPRLWDLGFVLDHAARSSRECLDLARDHPSVLASLLNRRFLWGGFGLFAALDADLAGLFSGPDAARWRGAVGSAMASTRGDALNGVQTPNEPDVKRSPGGLRDLQRALSVNTLASGRPAALAEPALIEAHRFLWLVRCHLHLLVGGAEDRLSSALQPDVARRLGFDEPRGTTAAPPLLHIFRRHAHNVLQAAALATASIPAQLR
ncbi:MAG: [protein-PII] uridylyltransferase [Rhodospirillaceae bacterium]|jgi:[protein-PII] uridylyltransferase|nr:[protein-PII] uridylyltransferase [Rhodospirillaceae bacterium]